MRVVACAVLAWAALYLGVRWITRVMEETDAARRQERSDEDQEA